MNSTRNDIKRYLEKLHKENTPHGIKGAFEQVVDRIRFREVYKEDKWIESVISEYNSDSKCSLLFKGGLWH